MQLGRVVGIERRELERVPQPQPIEERPQPKPQPMPEKAPEREKVPAGR